MRGNWARGAAALVMVLTLMGAGKQKPRSSDLSPAKPASPYHWRLAYESEGLSVYWSPTPGDGVMTFRLEGILDLPPDRAAALFLDPAQHPLGLQGTLVEEKGPEGSVWVRTDLCQPAPFTRTRRYVTRLILKKEPSGLRLEARALEVPEGNPAALLGGFSGDLHLTPMTLPGQTFCRAEFHCGMGGKLPVWLVNLIEQAWPREAFRSVKAALRP